jgi:hypothetical protein
MDSFKEYKDFINQWQDDAMEPIEGKTWVELVTLLRLKLDDIEAHVDDGIDKINDIIK